MIIRFSGSANPHFNDKDFFFEDIEAKSIKSIFTHIYTNITTEYSNSDGSIREGVLCLLDDSDWELSDCYNSNINKVKVITLINTIHGG